MSVIAHVDHGKSTLTDSLVQKAGIISAQAAGTARFTDNRADEAERGITIKSTGVSMYFEYDMVAEKKLDAEDAAEATGAAADLSVVASAEAKAAEEAQRLADEKGIEISERSFLINLIDSPGHVDFSSEVTAALRVTDGALVVVDSVEGVAVQTETVLRQAIGERVRPVLMMNKVDRCITELMLPPEEAYRMFVKNIENVNVIIETYKDPVLGDLSIEPTKGNMAMGSGLHQWGYTLKKFAKMYAAKFQTSRYKMIRRLWGDVFYNKKGEWKRGDYTQDKDFKRGYVGMCLEPIYQLFDCCINDKADKLEKILAQLGILLKTEEKELKGKQLMKKVMQKWLPMGDTVLEMLVLHLPSPKDAQVYRTEQLYEGPMDDPCAVAMKNCDSNGPLMMYISKMVPTADPGRFYGFGRVFSGKVATGQKVRIMGPNYQPGQKTDLWVKNIQRTVIMMGNKAEAVADIPSGNTCALVGVDNYLIKTGTISDHDDAHNIKVMKFSVSPVVRVAVECKNSQDLPKLVPTPKDYKVQAKEIAEAHGFDADQVGQKRLWAFGPDGSGPNWVLDSTIAVQYLSEIKESVNSGFQWGTKSGPLCGEQLRGVIIKLMDVTLHADSIHRGMGQILPAARQVLFACMYLSAPTLMEPFYQADIAVPVAEAGGVYSTLALRRGQIVEEIPRAGTPMTSIKAYLPVNESFGFTGALRAATGGQAFPQCSFDHWEAMTGDPFKAGNKVYDIVRDTRKRKGMKEEMPPLEEYLDKL